MKPLFMKWAVMIDVNNICHHNCIYCTKYIRHLPKHKKFQMTNDEIVVALQSLEGWPGKIGLTGGDPLNHPEFETICELVRKYVPKQKAMIFTSHKTKFLKYKKVIDATFGEVYLNFHDKNQKQVCKHQPLTIAVEDVAPTATVMWELIENCWCNDLWSPIVGKKGAFFCDVAIGLDNALDLNGGWKVEPGWWMRSDYSDQAQRYCKYCGMCVPYPQQVLADNKEKFSLGLYNLFKEKGLINLEDVEIIDRKLSIDELGRNLVGWRPWRNREDKDMEGPAYCNP